ncbi:hypothetical protein F6P96_00835 [Escherichia coli]|nr:hypothetical protein F6P96_00835 [Escherichia coli]
MNYHRIAKDTEEGKTGERKIYDWRIFLFLLHSSTVTPAGDDLFPAEKQNQPVRANQRAIDRRWTR